MHKEVTSECNVSDSDLISLLRLGHSASQTFQSMQQFSSGLDTHTWIERTLELFRSPLFTVFMLEKFDPPTQVAGESVMDPTAFIRLLTVLAQRGILQDIRKLKKLPVGTSPSTSLTQVKQIADAEGLQRSLPS
jgi:hypothetical protein